MPQAEQILKEALDLDPQNYQAQIMLARFYFKLGEEERALELCRKYGALIKVPRLTQAPVIDGDPIEAVWDQGYSSENFYLNTSRWVARPSEGKSKAYIGHRNGWLYIAVIGYEQDFTKLVRERSFRDRNVWEDDSVELIFDPGSTENEHIQFVINSIGTFVDLVNWDSRKNKKCQYAARIFEDRGYWACEFTVKGTELHKIRNQTGDRMVF